MSNVCGTNIAHNNAGIPASKKLATKGSVHNKLGNCNALSPCTIGKQLQSEWLKYFTYSVAQDCWKQ